MIQEIIVNVATVLILSLVTYLIGKVGQLVSTYIKKNNIKISQETIDHVTASFKAALTQAIIATNQTYVDDLKANGKFDSEAMTEAMNKTIKYCKQMLASDVLDYLEKNYTDVNQLIEATAETIIGASKGNSVDTSSVVSTIVDYMSKLPNNKQYTMEELTAELRTHFNLTK